MWRLLFADAFQLDVKSQASLLAVAGGYVSAVEEDGMLYYIEELMQELQKEVTILIVTHNMGQAMRISSQVHVHVPGRTGRVWRYRHHVLQPLGRAHQGLPDGKDGLKSCPRSAGA